MARIGLLTGGGDCPGLNPVIRGIVRKGIDHYGHEIFGFRKGWKGVLDNDAIELTRENTSGILHKGGTILGTSRTNVYKTENGEERVLASLKERGIDVLIPIGGDDTLSYGLRMHEEGVPTIAIPKTMDNDVNGTDYCIGFSTAVTRGVQFIHNLRTSTGSHERIAVVELFGRYSGETSLITAYLAGVDRALIPEVPFDVDRVCELLLADKARNPSNYAMLTISEGATIKGGDMMLSGEEDAYGHRKLGGIGQVTGELIKERTGEGIVYQQVGYLMRSGSPDSLDLMVATNYAVMAADLALDGSTGRMVSLRNGSYSSVPISVTGEGVKRVDVGELYDAPNYVPKVRHVRGKPMFLY